MSDNNHITERLANEFSDICPIADSDFQARMKTLVAEEGFENALRYVMPNVDYPDYSRMLCSIRSKDEFQQRVMAPFLTMLLQKTSDGITASGFENLEPGVPYVYMSNHRDIVLDSALLNYVLLTNGHPTSEIAIGSNLLIFPWIDTLVRLNKSVVVKRNLPLRQAFEAAVQLSRYIHFAINDIGDSVWIAQREGRAKDSSDNTQESLVKMLTIDGTGSILDRLAQVNINPVAISYEFDPNDYLKCREFLLRRRDPDFKKSQHDDLLSMETGLLQPKGRIHYHFAGCINDRLAAVAERNDKTVAYAKACEIIDRGIHANYRLFPGNLIAYDKFCDTTVYTSEYSQADVEAFTAYCEAQLDKVDVDGITAEEREFMHQMMLKMYANPVINKRNASAD